ncbi:MAG: hypothetical protein QME41_03645, partial [Actinomycetota bacterium]|nr:hypothetical protein [Actinomycetota bacterium]
MINERDRIGFASRKSLAPWIASAGLLSLCFRLKHIAALIILAALTAVLVLSYAAGAFAESQLTKDGGVELTVGSTVGEETAAVGAEE